MAQPADICILLVAPEIPSMQKTLEVLLDFNYTVAIAFNAKQALVQIVEKERRVDLVLTEINLPDMCPVMFVRILDVIFRTPVVMLLEKYHIPTMLDALSNGAMYCFGKRLHPHNARNLWQYALYEGEETIESSRTDEESKMVGAEKITALPVARNNPLPHPLVWSLNLQSRLLSVIPDLEISDATPAELLRHINASRLSIINEAPIQAATVNAGQRLLSPGHSTSTLEVTLALPAAHPLMEDATENNNQLEPVPTASPILDPTAFQSASSSEGNGEGTSTSSTPDESFAERFMNGP